MALTRTGSEWQINTPNPISITVLENGNVVVLEVNKSPDRYDFVGQIYSPAGAKIGQSFSIKSFAPGDIFSVGLEALPDGRFVVSYDYRPGGREAESYVETGIFNADGSVSKALSRVGSTGAKWPGLTILDDGSYVISYDDSATKIIKHVIFDKNGNPGTTFEIAAREDFAFAAGLTDGTYVTVTADLSPSGTETQIKAHLRSPSGAMKEVLITAVPADPYAAGSVVGLKDGNFVVAWSDDGDKSIKAQIVSASGALIGGEVLLHQSTTDRTLSISELIALPDGGFALGFVSLSPDYYESNPSDVYIGTYSATGAVVTAPILAHPKIDGRQDALELYVLKNGTLLANWFGVGEDQNYFQIFDGGYPPPTNNPGGGGSGGSGGGSSGVTRIGGKGKDVLVGGASNDKLSGGYGNDKLTGLGGADIFVFDAKLGTAKTDRKVNFDTITDFKAGEDKIWLDNKIFTKLGKAGSEASPAAMNKKFFKVGNKAKDKDDYVFYDKKTGVLSYDADGKGAKAAIEIAKLAKNLKLSSLDFAIV